MDVLSLPTVLIFSSSSVLSRLCKSVVLCFLLPVAPFVLSCKKPRLSIESLHSLSVTFDIDHAPFARCYYHNHSLREEQTSCISRLCSWALDWLRLPLLLMSSRMTTAATTSLICSPLTPYASYTCTLSILALTRSRKMIQPMATSTTSTAALPRTPASSV